jgi:hypothetical protein
MFNAVFILFEFSTYPLMNASELATFTALEVTDASSFLVSGSEVVGFSVLPQDVHKTRMAITKVDCLNMGVVLIQI